MLCPCGCSFAELERVRPVPFAGLAVQRNGQEREMRSREKPKGFVPLCPALGGLGFFYSPLQRMRQGNRTC